MANTLEFYKIKGNVPRGYLLGERIYLVDRSAGRATHIGMNRWGKLVRDPLENMEKITQAKAEKAIRLALGWAGGYGLSFWDDVFSGKITSAEEGSTGPDFIRNSPSWSK